MITLIATSDGFKHFESAIKEYTTRCQKFLKIKLLKPIAHTNIEYIKIKETLQLKEILSKTKWKIFIADERGKSLSTRGLVEIIEKNKNEGNDIIFVIGGSYGIDLEVLGNEFSFIKISDCILPHSLAFLLMIEQIYRAHEIIKWSKYHHE